VKIFVMYMRKKFRINYLFFSDLETDIKPSLKASLEYTRMTALISLLC